MKNILLSIDFSKNATNAALYAAALAKHTGARLILFHAYNPIALTEQEELNDEPEDTERNVQDKLDALAIKLRTQEAISVTRLLKPGNVVDETLYVAKKIKADLIVVGVEKTTQNHYPVPDALTNEILEKTSLPILLLPPKAVFKPFELIHLAFEETEAEHDLVNIRFMNKLLYTFRSAQFSKQQKLQKESAAQVVTETVGAIESLADSLEAIQKENPDADLKELTYPQQTQLMVQAYANAGALENNLKQHCLKLAEAIPFLLLPPAIL